MPSAHSHSHLELARERPVTERRSPRGFPRVEPPGDRRAHAEDLAERFRKEREAAATDLGGYDDRRLVKIRLRQKVSPEDVSKASAGIEVVSQEEDMLVLGFATEAQLEAFEAKLSSFAADGDVTYKTLLYALQDFDRWTPEDRTGFALRREGFPGSTSFAIDAELWPLPLRTDMTRQRQAFEEWISTNGGTLLDSVRTSYLTVYRILCDRTVADRLLRHRDVRTVDLPPRIGLERSLVLQDIQELPPVSPPPADAPGVVVLDTGVVTGHPLLASAVGDSQSFLDGAPAGDDHGHGTFVSGIALYDDVARLRDSEEGIIPELRLFSGRVFDESNEADPRLIENQVERAVRYFVETYRCRVFNLSYGNTHKPYEGRHVAGLAVTLDALSRELDVLFVVPTGNYKGGDDGPANWREDYPTYLTEEAARLLDPAPALNVLTVGSLARHERHERWPEDAGYRPVARTEQPSPFTRSGPSVNGAVKPDLVDFGGNLLVMSAAGDQPLWTETGGGELSLSNRFATGRAWAEDSGTSFAAPRVAHAAAKVFSELPEASVDLCRALLVAHARIPPACTELFGDDAEACRNVAGYGWVNRSALYRSTDNSVTLWATETIPNRSHHFFEIPIPDEFWAGGRRARELTVALAYRPPVRTTRVDYRASRISFKLVQAGSLDEVTGWFNATVDAEGLESIPERTGGRGLTETIRSRGTVQASTWSFTRPSRAARECRWFVVVTRNDHPWGQALTSESEPYALVVTLDDRQAPQLELATTLYAQVQVALRERARARIRP